MYIYIYIYVYVCVCVDVCEYICIYRHTHTDIYIYIYIFGKGTNALIPLRIKIIVPMLFFYKDVFDIKQPTRMEMVLNKETKKSMYIFRYRWFFGEKIYII